jgi:predicted ATPase
MVGANGAGKSNLLLFFQMLNYAMTGGLQIFVAKRGGANRLLYCGSKQTPQLTARLTLCADQGTNEYRARLFHAAGDTLVFAEETVSFQREGFPSRPAYSLGAGHRESMLSDDEKLGSQAGYQTARAIKTMLKRWNHFHFHDTSDTAAVKQAADIADSRYLRSDAGNLAAFLYGLQQNQPDYYRQIRDTIRLAAPFFDDFVLEPDLHQPRVIKLLWRSAEARETFDAYYLSDGTLRFMCLAALLLQPSRPNLIVIDEPELGLHPSALRLLASMLRSAAQHTQVLVATQSVNLVDEFEPQDVIVADRDHGSSVFRRLDTEALGSWLQEYSLGEIWQKNLIGGRP